jgi:hypothetical protein
MVKIRKIIIAGIVKDIKTAQLGCGDEIEAVACVCAQPGCMGIEKDDIGIDVWNC